jgi:hypothetical protein
MKYKYIKPWHKVKRAIRHKVQNHNINICSTTLPLLSTAAFIFLEQMCSSRRIDSEEVIYPMQSLYFYSSMFFDIIFCFLSYSGEERIFFFSSRHFRAAIVDCVTYFMKNPSCEGNVPVDEVQVS